MEFYFDKQSFKILKTIYKNPGITEGELNKKFGDDATSMFLISLTKSLYLIAEKEDGSFADFSKLPYFTTSNFQYWPTPKLNVLIEDRFRNRWLFIFPYTITTIIAITSLFVSVASNWQDIFAFLHFLFPLYI